MPIVGSEQHCNSKNNEKSRKLSSQIIIFRKENETATVSLQKIQHTRI